MSNPASNELSGSNEVASNEERSSSLSLSSLSDLPDEFRNEIIDIILRKVQEEIRLGNVDPNEIGPDGKTILERIGAMELLRVPSNQ
ncbi:MAG: hypothetical protein IKA36_03655 [Clostridia bacterium]|nr:hypothetical protein [Clostridia bacterium]